MTTLIATPYPYPTPDPLGSLLCMLPTLSSGNFGNSDLTPTRAMLASPSPLSGIVELLAAVVVVARAPAREEVVEPPPPPQGAACPAASPSPLAAAAAAAAPPGELTAEADRAHSAAFGCCWLGLLQSPKGCC